MDREIMVLVGMIIFNVVVIGIVLVQPESVRKEVATNLSVAMNESFGKPAPIDNTSHLVKEIACNENGCFARFTNGKIWKVPEDPWNAQKVMVGHCYSVTWIIGWSPEMDCITGQFIGG